MNKILLSLTTAVFTFSAGVNASEATVAQKPNLIFFLMDDLGWSDLSCMGSKFYESPAIDKLAADGIKFTRAYQAAPRCAPSRLSILTGKNHNRLELLDKQGMRLEEVTFAEAFKEGGYSTFFAGKWHEGAEGRWPQDQGFDINKGGCSLGALTTHFWPYTLPDKKARTGHKEEKNTVPYGLEEGKTGEYIADRLTDEAIKFLKDHKRESPDKPFLIELSHYLVHQPLEGKPELVKHFEEKLKGMPKIEGPDFENDYTGKVKLKQDLPVYAAMIKSIDESVERVRQALVELGYDKNTIIVLASDNGGLSTCDLLGNRSVSTSNKPLRTGKGWLYEGGMRVPVMVYWPGVTKAGTETDRAITGTDFYPTFLEMAGLPLRPQQHVDGESFASVLKGDLTHPRKPIFWYFDDARVGTGNTAMAAMLDGDMKLVHFVQEEKDELYNIRDDIGEHHDLAAANSEKVKAMKDALNDFEKNIQVRPMRKKAVDQISALLDELKGVAPKKAKNAEEDSGGD